SSHIGVGAHFEVRTIDENRQYGRLRSGLRIQEAAEALAKSTHVAWPHPNAIGIGIGSRAIGRGQGKRFVAELACRFGKELRTVNRRQGGARKVIASCAFERIAARPDGSSEIA